MDKVQIDTLTTALPPFLTGEGRRVDDVHRYVDSWLKDHQNGQLYVGCDSKVRGDIVKYAVVICLWDVGRGVNELYRKLTIPRPPDRYTRLWNEVTYAVETADALRPITTNITVHVDINSDARFRSHQLYDASMGLISSMGFHAAGKPNSWAASCGANRHCQ